MVVPVAKQVGACPPQRGGTTPLKLVVVSVETQA